MRKVIYIVLSAAFVLSFTSCKEKSRVQREQEFISELTKEDTTQMLKLSDGCMDLLKQNKIDEALSMLYEYDEESKALNPLSDETRKRLQKQFKFFPVLEYTRNYYSFMLEGVNDVKYVIKFAEEEHPEENGEAKTAFMLNPVRVDGTWYLTVKNGSDFDHLQN